MSKYLSNRQKNLKVGIESYTENLTSLSVVGKVGIGTTNASTDLDVVGDVRIRGGILDLSNSSGTNSYVVTANGSGGWSWQPVSAGVVTYVDNAGYATTAGIATNLKGGDVGDIPYQSATDTTTFVDASTALNGQVLLYNGSIPIWGNVSAASGAFGGITVYDEGVLVGTSGSITSLDFVGSGVVVEATSGPNGIATVTVGAGYATTAGIATNLKGGSGGEIVYQSAADTTAFLTNGTSGYLLQANGGTNPPTWVPAAPASNGEFYTGVSSSLQLTPLSYETSIYTFPSTAGKQYVIESINVANVDTSVGVGTTVNIIASIEDSTGEQTYIAYNVPIVNGGLIELLKNPIVAGPSDVMKMWVTNDAYTGVNNAAEVYMNYSEYTSTEYVREYASTVSIATTDITTVYTSSTYPSVIESIHLANRTDVGDYPVSVVITNGVTTTFLAKDLVIPRYSTVDILDRPKRIELNGTLGIKVGQTSTIDVIIAGKQIT